MESLLKEQRGGESVLDLSPRSTVGGGVEDVYGEDRALEDQLVTPWTVSVASGYNLLRDPHHNKGLAFTQRERDAHYLRGLLPPAVLSQELQEKKLMHNLRQYQFSLHKYMTLMELEERNERLFYKLLIDNVEELLPVVYTPTVGEACQKYGSIFRRPQGLYISLKEKGKILEVLRNWPEKSIKVIVVTDGERILGLGDLGCQGMGIPVGKLALYTALGGVRPSACLPITIDVGTNNEKLLNDEFYIGLRQRRATGREYYDLLHEFMTAVKQNYGEKVLIQFEDFANHNAFELLAKYGTTHLVFNDDIQGTASVVLSGLVASLKLLGGTLTDHTFLFLGAGENHTRLHHLLAFLNPLKEELWVFGTKKPNNAKFRMPNAIWLKNKHFHHSHRLKLRTYEQIFVLTASNGQRITKLYSNIIYFFLTSLPRIFTSIRIYASRLLVPIFEIPGLFQTCFQLFVVF